MARNYGVGSSTIGRVLKKLGYSRKKSQTYTERSEEKRAVYAAEIKALKFEKLVFVDESGMNDNDFYPYAYSVIGKRHYEAHSGHYKKRISMIGGLCNQKFIAPFIFVGHCNTAVFEKYIEKILIPQFSKGMVLIVDNAAFHKSVKIKNLIQSYGIELIDLPPYSPDLNPIENYWHKIKNSIRKLMRSSKLLLENAMEITLKNMSSC